MTSLFCPRPATALIVGAAALIAVAAATSSPARAMVPINVSTAYTGHDAIADHRQTGPGNFSLSQFEFVFGLRTFNDQNYKAQLQVGLPLRTLQMNSGASTNVGSEFGGYRVAWNQTLMEFIGWDINYAKNSSSRLNLFAENTNLESVLSVKTMAFALPSVLVKAMAGPGIRLTRSEGAASVYGPMYVARAGVEAIWANQNLGKWAMGVAGTFRHRSSYREDGQTMRATLFTLQPQVAWEIVKDLWITGQYTRVLARPIGFEQAMGDAGLSGLYGDAFSVGVSTISL